MEKFTKKSDNVNINIFGIVLLILTILFVFGIGGVFCYEKFKNSKNKGLGSGGFKELVNPDLKIYRVDSNQGLFKSQESIGNQNSTYEGPTSNIVGFPNYVKRPNHPKWYKDIPENHPEVLQLYKQAENSRRNAKKYTKLGYEKRKAPKEIFEYLQKIARTTDRTKEGSKNIFRRTSSGLPPYVISFSEDRKKWIGEKMKPILEEWSGIELEYECLYGARDYPKGSSLRMHCDRDTHIISVIFHIEREGCDGKNWALEVIGFDGIKRDIYMEPGEMVLYESNSVPHSRFSKNPCDSFVNAFLHFHPFLR